MDDVEQFQDSWWILFLLLQIFVIGGVATLALRQFVSFRRTIWYATFFSVVGWALCFSIVFLIPVDIIDNDVGESGNRPVTYLPPNVLRVEWNVLYWGTFILSWVVFPFLQSYWLAGDFSKFEKFFSSFKENIYIYVIMGVLGGSGLIFLKIKDNLQTGDVRQLTVLLANMYGLIIVVLLMGYGLVDIPRYLFKKADRQGWLKHYMVQAAVYKKEVEVTKAKLEDTLQKIRTVSQKIGQDNKLRPFVETILSKCPDNFSSGQAGRFSVDADKEQRVTYDSLVSLHQKVMNLDHAHTRALRLFDQIVSKSLNLEDVLHSKTNPERKIEWHFRAHKTGRFAGLKSTLEWYWQVYFYTWYFFLLGLFCGVLSLILVWCEVVMPFEDQDNLSLLNFIITDVPLRGIPKQLYCIVILTYMATCTYTSLFKLQIWDYYRLVPHQQSDANSIMFSANYLCRLAAPLSYNFLALTRQVNSAQYFSEVMGPMGGYFTLGKNFMYVFPIFVAIFCLCTLLNVWQRIFRSSFMKHMFKSCWPIKKLKVHIEDPRNLLEEGALILKHERDKREESNTGVNFDSVGDVSDKYKNIDYPSPINKNPRERPSYLDREKPSYLDRDKSSPVDRERSYVDKPSSYADRDKPLDRDRSYMNRDRPSYLDRDKPSTIDRERSYVDKPSSYADRDKPLERDKSYLDKSGSKQDPPSRPSFFRLGSSNSGSSTSTSTKEERPSLRDVAPPRFSFQHKNNRYSTLKSDIP